MPGRGPAPKANKVRRNREPEKTLLKSSGRKYGFPLPKNAVDKDGTPIVWHPMTRKWWESWRASPQATRMLSEPDWFFLLDTALIHHNMWMNGRWEFAGEVRLRVAKFGATPEDRMRLKAEIEDPEKNAVGSAPGATVTSIQDRRSRLA